MPKRVSALAVRDPVPGNDQVHQQLLATVTSGRDDASQSLKQTKTELHAFQQAIANAEKKVNAIHAAIEIETVNERERIAFEIAGRESRRAKQEALYDESMQNLSTLNSPPGFDMRSLRSCLEELNRDLSDNEQRCLFLEGLAGGLAVAEPEDYCFSVEVIGAATGDVG